MIVLRSEKVVDVASRASRDGRSAPSSERVSAAASYSRFKASFALYASCSYRGRFCALEPVFFVLTFSNSHSFCSLLHRRHGGSSGFPGSPRSHLTFRARQPMHAWYPRVKLCFGRRPLASTWTCVIWN